MPPLSPVPPEHLQAAGGFERFSRGWWFKKGLVGGAPRGGLGSPEGSVGDALILVEAPRDCEKFRGGLRAPNPSEPPKPLPGCGLDRFEVPRPWWHLEASWGFPETTFLERQARERLWGATAFKDPSGERDHFRNV